MNIFYIIGVGGRDHSSRRFFGPASIRKSCKPCPRAVLQDTTRAQGIELSDFGLRALL
jgi:hypothetical protein